MEELLEQLIDKLLDRGFEVVLCKNNGIREYDLQVEAKSGLHLYITTEGNIAGKGRYDISTLEGNDLDELWGNLLMEVKGCMCGRDYIAPNWLHLLVEEGYLIKKTETITIYEGY